MTQSEKKAGIGDVLKGVFTNPATAIPLLSMVAAPAVGAGINAAVDYKSRLRGAKEKTIAYHSMLDLHPHLKKRDSAEVSRIYNSLHNVNPTLARDPLVAGAWVDNIIESKDQFGGSHQAVLTAVKDLSGIRNQLSGAMRNESGQSSAGHRFEQLVTGLGSQLGKAYEHADRDALGVGMAELDKREAAIAEKDRLLSARSRELRQQDAHLSTLAQQLERFKDDLGGEKKASAQDLERLFSDLGV